jgi:GT2 family glycosyltransferase
MISVVIPTYHRNDLLAVCLELLRPGVQTLPADQYEVIVTDDGSQSTAEGMIAQRHPWVRWVAGPRRGPAANRNSGVRHARGEFIAFTDDDCLPSSGWLSTFAQAITDNVDVYEGKTTCSAGIRSPLDEAPVNLTGGCLWSCNMMVRAELFRMLGGFDEDFPFACEDVEFSDRLNLNGIPWRFIPDAAVDHPVRRRVLGSRAGARWKSRVMLWYKQGNQVSAWRWLPVHLLKVRLRHVFEFPFSSDSVVAIGSLVLEFGHVISHLSSWDAEYRGSAATWTSRRRSPGAKAWSPSESAGRHHEPT